MPTVRCLHPSGTASGSGLRAGPVGVVRAVNRPVVCTIPWIPVKPEYAARRADGSGIPEKRGSRMAQDRFFRVGQGFGQGINPRSGWRSLGSPQTLPVTSPPDPDIRRGGQVEAGPQRNEAPDWPRIDLFGWGRGLDSGEIPGPACIPWQPSDTQQQARVARPG